MALITYKGIGEGEVFNKWLHSRLIKNNKNVLSAELGGTGSGKSYRDLRKAELWYDYHFKEKFPVENICFGISHTMERLDEGNLRKGELLIVEEAGVNLGSRNWQSNVSKMFNFILQSFRSMNIGVFFNLPYLSMLDSQARHLLHYYAESSGIDYEKKINKCKPFFLQVAQGTGKIYRHYPKVKINGRTIKVQRFNYSLPSQYLIDAYEDKKDKYLKKLIKEYANKTNGVENGNKGVIVKPLTAWQEEIKESMERLGNQVLVAKEKGKSQSSISQTLSLIKKKGVLIRIAKK